MAKCNSLPCYISLSPAKSYISPAVSAFSQLPLLMQNVSQFQLHHADNLLGSIRAHSFTTSVYLHAVEAQRLLQQKHKDTLRDTSLSYTHCQNAVKCVKTLATFATQHTAMPLYPAVRAPNSRPATGCGSEEQSQRSLPGRKPRSLLTQIRDSVINHASCRWSPTLKCFTVKMEKTRSPESL